MKKITYLFTLMLAMLFSVGAMAETVTMTLDNIEVYKSGQKVTPGSSYSYNHEVRSTSTPLIRITIGTGDVVYRTDKFCFGNNQRTYTLSIADGYVINGFTINYTTGSHVRFSSNGVTSNDDGALTVTNLGKQSTTFYVDWTTGGSSASWQNYSVTSIVVDYTESVDYNYSYTQYDMEGNELSSAVTGTANGTSAGYFFTIPGHANYVFDHATDIYDNPVDLSVMTTETNLKLYYYKDPSSTITAGTDNANKLQQLYGLVQAYDATTENIVSNYKETSEGSYAALIDGTFETFFHSAFNGTTTADHNLTFTLDRSIDEFYFYMKKRHNNNNNRPTAMTIEGSVDGTTWETISDITISGVSAAQNNTVKDYFSAKLGTTGMNFNKIRFTVRATNNMANNNGHVFFTASEWYIVPSNPVTDAYFAAAKALRDGEYTGATVGTYVNNMNTAITALDEALANQSHTITLTVKNNGNVIKTGEIEAINGNSYDLYHELGISNAFVTLDPATVTGTAIDQNIEVTATFNLPFELTTDFTNANWYYMNVRNGRWMQYNAEYDGTVAYSTSNAKCFGVLTQDNYVKGDDSYMWAFGGDPVNGIKVYNKAAGEGQMLQATTDAPSFGSDDASWVIAKNGDGFTLHPAGSNNYINEKNFNPRALFYWNSANASTDGGSTFRVEDATSFIVTYQIVDGSNNLLAMESEEVSRGTEVKEIKDFPSILDQSLFYDYAITATTVSSNCTIAATATTKANPTIKLSTDFDNATWYTLNLDQSHYYMVFSALDTPMPCKASSITTPTYANGELWAFVGNPYTGLTVYNKAAGSTASLSWGTDDDANFTVSLGGSSSGGDYFPVVSTGNTQQWFAEPSADRENGFYLVTTNKRYGINARNEFSFWTNGKNAGSTFVATEVSTTALAALLQETVDYVESFNFGPDFGQYNSGEITAEQRSAALTAANGMIANPEAYTIDQFALAVNTATALTEQIKLNMPKEGDAFRIKSTHGTYVSGTPAGGTVGNRLSLTTDVDDLMNTIFFYTGNKLACYGRGTWAKGRDIAEIADEAGITYTFEEHAGIPGTYLFHFDPKDGGVERVFYAWDTSKNYCDQSGYNAANSAIAETSFTLEAVTELPVVVTDALYATIAVPAPVQASGVELNALTAAADGWATLTPVTGAVAANTPMIVKAEAAGTYNLNIVATGDEVAGNLLKATNFGGEALNAETDFVLGMVGGNVGLYKIDASDNKARGFRAYLSNTSGVSGFVFQTDDVTGLNSLNLDTKANNVFDLQGRRVSKAQKGLFIVNGKKVVLK